MSEYFHRPEFDALEGDHAPMVVRGGPADVVALTWNQLEYRPDNSLVLVGLEGSRRRTGVIVRADLPDPGQEAALIDHLAQPLLRTGARAAIGLVFAEAALTAPEPPVVGQLSNRLPTHGLTVVDALGVTRGSYRSYLCTDVDCCPAAGHPLRDVETSPAAAAFIVRGRIVAADSAALMADVIPAEGSDTAIAEHSVDGPLSPESRHAALADWRGQLVSDQPVEPRWAATFGQQLADSRLRDAVLVSLASPVPEAADEVLAGRELGAALDGPPDPARLEPGRALLAAAARLTPPGSRADALACLAWLSWYQGSGVRSRLLAELAIADQPEHRLAALVDQLLASGIPPPWVSGSSFSDAPPQPASPGPPSEAQVTVGAGRALSPGQQPPPERPTRRLTAEEREERLQAVQDKLATGVAELINSDQWRAMLKATAKFHTYSWRNSLLLVLQDPDATQVAGYRTWQSLGRQVRRGEKGLQVLAPLTYRPKEREAGRESPTAGATPDDGEEQPSRRISGWKIEHVYDIRQTDGEPLPVVSPEQVSDEPPAGFKDVLVEQITARGFTVEHQVPIGAALGQTNFTTRQVLIHPELSAGQSAKTTAHELGHIVLEHGDANCADPRSRKEVEAESLAFIICEAVGLDTSNYTFPYVAGWAPEGKQVEEIAMTADRVVVAARGILQQLPGFAGTVEDTSPAPTLGRQLHELASQVDDLSHAVHETSARQQAERAAREAAQQRDSDHWYLAHPERDEPELDR